VKPQRPNIMQCSLRYIPPEMNNLTRNNSYRLNVTPQLQTLKLNNYTDVPIQQANEKQLPPLTIKHKLRKRKKKLAST